MKSIKIKTWLYIMVVVAIIFACIWLLQVVFIQNFYEFSKERYVRNVQKQIVASLENNDLQTGYRKILSFMEEGDLYVEVYDETFENVLHPFMFISLDDLRNKRFSVNQMLPATQMMSVILSDLKSSGEQQSVVKVKDRTQETSSIILTDQIKNGGHDYYVATKTSLLPVKATSAIVKDILIISLCFVLIIATIVAFILASSIARPIRQLSAGARKVAEGNYDISFTPHSQDEIGVLMQDFNYMTGELSKVDNNRKDLIANVSHELRTPLTMIRGYAETIRDLTGDSKERREKQLGIIIEESDRLSGLISTMLDLSQLQAGKIQFRFEPFDFSDMVQRMLQKYDIFKDQGYTIQTDIAQNVQVCGDCDRLQQVVCNLIDNAINHSGDEKTVSVTLTGGSKPTFSVHNTGDVIAKEDLPHIWDRYYRIDKSGKRRVTGTGIGLSIVKEILKAHQFPFGVTSTEADGTTFWVSLEK